MRPLNLEVIWLLALMSWTSPLVGCGHRTGATPEPRASWQDPELRSQAGLEMASKLVDLGRSDDALLMVRQLEQAGQGSLDLDLVQARALAARGQLSEAEALLVEIKSQRPRNPEALGMLGNVLFDQGRLDDAEPLLQRATEIDPENPRWLNNLGFLLIVRGRPAQAQEALQRAVRLDPSNKKAFNNLGFALVAQGRDTEALEAFRSSSDEAGALANLGLGCERRGDLQRAIDLFRSAQALDSRQAVAIEGIDRLWTHVPQEKPLP